MRVLRCLLPALFVLLAANVLARPGTDAVNCLLPKPKTLKENGTRFRMRRAVRLTDPTGCTLLASLFRTSVNASATVSVCMTDDASICIFVYFVVFFKIVG